MLFVTNSRPKQVSMPLQTGPSLRTGAQNTLCLTMLIVLHRDSWEETLTQTTEDQQHEALARKMHTAGVAFLDLVHLTEQVQQVPCHTARLLVDDKDSKRMFDLVGTERRPPTRWFTRNVDCRSIKLPGPSQTLVTLVSQFFDEHAQPIESVEVKVLDFVTIVPVWARDTDDWVHIRVGSCMNTPDGWLIAPMPKGATILEVS